MIAFCVLCLVLNIAGLVFLAHRLDARMKSGQHARERYLVSRVLAHQAERRRAGQL